MGELCWRRGCALQMHQDGADSAGKRETRRPQSKEGDMHASGAAAAAAAAAAPAHAAPAHFWNQLNAHALWD